LKRDLLKLEENFFKKRWRGRVPIALIFPNKYELGMANLGFLTLYQRLNQYEELVCERVFYEQGEIRSIESNRPLRDFPLLLFSIPFEGDYINVLRILKDGGISLEPKERAQTILAGGVALWANPEPLAPFIDGFLLGEWEALEEKIIPVFVEEAFSKDKLIQALSKFEFFYSPAHFEKKRVRVEKVKRPENPLLSTVLSDKAKFGRSYLLEVSKGCGRACRFCLAGFIYRPPRRYSVEALLEKVKEIPDLAKVGLIGLEFVDKEEVLKLGESLLSKKCVLTFSSLRIDAINEEFLKLLKGAKSVALAPETASLRLKRVINKFIEEEEIYSVLDKLKRAGLKKVKIYFMLGLPFEEEEDIIETAKFINRLLQRRVPFHFTFTFSFFVPKPHTPFQWAEFNGITKLERKRDLLLKEVSSVKGIKFESPKEAFLQALLARGSADLKEFLLKMAEGTPLKQALSLVKDLERYLSPLQSMEESFPWDIIDIGVSKDFLWREWKRAQAQKTTPFCKRETCRACSACKKLYSNSGL
jgi:radical SAM superfamily enzyme YgiQ (UPF0313 family)